MSGVRSGCVVRDVIAQDEKTHIHCPNCDLIDCSGIELREALPAKDPAPEWLRRARMEGRAEFLAVLLDTNPESFANDNIGSHAIGDTGDYGEHWETQKLAEMFEVDEPSQSYIERIEGAYWSQQNTIDELKDERDRLLRDADRLNWLDANGNGVQWTANSGFVYWPAGEPMVSGKTLREVIDRAREIEAAKAKP